MRVAIDTNVLVRLVTDDDPAQTAISRDRLTGRQLYLPKSVLLETTWILRYTYGLDRARIATVLRKVLGLEGAVVEAHAEVVTAVGWYASGLDFADALHLASSRDCEGMFTFDRRFATSAAACGASPAVAVLA